MTLRVECYWSFRSPYSYLATPRMLEWEEQYDLAFDVRVVYPLAIRVDGFFKNQPPQWLPYLVRDCAREAERLQLPLVPPDPDPVAMDLRTGEVPVDQPIIRRLTRLGAAASERGRGLPFIAEVSRLIWSGKASGWHEGQHLAEAAARAGLDLAEMNHAIGQDPGRYEEQILANQRAHATAGHWGVPLFCFRHEPFFGQDRMDALRWRLEQQGLAQRAASSNPITRISDTP